MAEVNVYRVTVTASEAGVRQALDEFERFSRAQGLPDDLRRRFLVALDETLSNVSRHGRPSGGVVQAGFKLADNCLTVTVEDDAPAFDPLDAPRPDTSSPLENRKAGGVGIELVRTLVEGVVYEHTGGRNRLTLTERLSRHSDHS